LFEEVGDHWREMSAASLRPTDERVLDEMALSPVSSPTLCYFSVPVEKVGIYRETLFPIAESFGFVPVASGEVLTPPGNRIAKLQALLERSAAAVIEATTPNGLYELGVAVNLTPPRVQRELADSFPSRRYPNLFVLMSVDQELPKEFRDVVRLERLGPGFDIPPEIGDVFRDWLAQFAPPVARPFGEPRRLVAAREYRAAVVAAWTLFEARLTEDPRIRGTVKGSRPPDVLRLVRQAEEMGILAHGTAEEANSWRRMRNELAHGLQPISRHRARAMVDRIIQVLDQLDLD